MVKAKERQMGQPSPSSIHRGEALSNRGEFYSVLDVHPTPDAAFLDYTIFKVEDVVQSSRPPFGFLF
jgi:hypothetical protein